MANLKVSEGVLSAYPWLEGILAATGTCRTRILMVADGFLDFGHHFFGLSRLVEALRQSSRPGAEIVVSTAHRGERSDGREAEDYLFKFEKETFGIDKYEQVWLFGYEATNGQLTESELKVLAEFMNQGGGVFATGDHADLGFALCGNVPRVRSMRKWCFPAGKDCTAPSPPRNGPERHSTVLEGRDPGFQISDEADDIPQTIFPKLYQNGCEVIPHQLLAFHNTAITILPDHRHEGDCVEPTQEQLGQKIKYGDDPEFDEFPLKSGGKARPAPEIIALSVSSGGPLKDIGFDQPPVIPRGFGAICAYDGDEVGVIDGHRIGRVVVDASFHHFVDMNLDGTGAPFGTGFFDASGRPTKHYEVITQYFRNIATYLNPFDFRQRCDLSQLVLLRFMYPLIEEIQRDEALTLDNILEVGGLTRRAISSYFSPAEVAEYAVTLLNSLEGHETLKSLINPRLAAPSEAQGLTAFLNSHAFTNAILGIALLSIAERLPHKTDRVADQFLEMKSLSDELASGVKDAVSRVAGACEQIVEQALKSPIEFSASSGGGEK
jgi:hypothetical protein